MMRNSFVSLSCNYKCYFHSLTVCLLIFCPFLFCWSEDCLSINGSSLDIMNGIYHHLMFEQVQRSCMCLCIFMYFVLCSRASQNLKEINSSISVAVWRTTEYLRSKQSEAETNTLAATRGLVLQPGFHFKMWMDSKLCAVIGAKNTLTHPAYTLSSWHVLCCIFIITLWDDRLSMNGCWSWRWEKPTVDLLL